jgi:hypothetical protein
MIERTVVNNHHVSFRIHARAMVEPYRSKQGENRCDLNERATLTFFTEISTPLRQQQQVDVPIRMPSDVNTTMTNVVPHHYHHHAPFHGVAQHQMPFKSESDIFQVGTFTDSILSAYRNAYRRFERASMDMWSSMSMPLLDMEIVEGRHHQQQQLDGKIEENECSGKREFQSGSVYIQP